MTCSRDQDQDCQWHLSSRIRCTVLDCSVKHPACRDRRPCARSRNRCCSQRHRKPRWGSIMPWNRPLSQDFQTACSPSELNQTAHFLELNYGQGSRKPSAIKESSRTWFGSPVTSGDARKLRDTMKASIGFCLLLTAQQSCLNDKNPVPSAPTNGRFVSPSPRTDIALDTQTGQICRTWDWGKRRRRCQAINAPHHPRWSL